jgi:pimeloyl-ACP methyl ester carboxylesterase
VWLLGGLAAAAAAGVAAQHRFLSGEAQPPWPPEPCVVQEVDARCGTYVVPEDRARPDGRTIGLHVVVLPAFLRPARDDAVAYLAGGPGQAATELAADLDRQLSTLNTVRDVILVDQRGTGRSRPHGGDVTLYGTRAAMDDLEAVRAALGYRQLDVIGSSYGATAAQVYANLHPSSVRTLVLSGGTALGVPFFERYAVNAQRALDGLAALCDSQPDCRRAFPGWERQFAELVQAWNARPGPMTGDGLAAVVQAMLLDVEQAVSIPLVVSSAARGDVGALERAGSEDTGVDLDLMGASIWCNEPWTGLDAEGPWGTDFDGYTRAVIASFRRECDSVERRTEPPSLWTLPESSPLPVLAFAGAADPQDPPANLAGLGRHFPDSRVVVLSHVGHQFGIGGCVVATIADLVERGTTEGLNTTRCDGAVAVPRFELPG